MEYLLRLIQQQLLLEEQQTAHSFTLGSGHLALAGEQNTQTHPQLPGLHMRLNFSLSGALQLSPLAA
jgi:hypothetical protein